MRLFIKIMKFLQKLLLLFIGSFLGVFFFGEFFNCTQLNPRNLLKRLRNKDRDSRPDVFYKEAVLNHFV